MLSIYRKKGLNLTKFCICIDIDKIKAGIASCIFVTNLQLNYGPWLILIGIVMHTWPFNVQHENH